MPIRETSQSHDVDAVVASTREIGALIARTLALVEPSVTMPQWRVIVLASQGGCNVSTIATDLEVHPSNATRICDRLVRLGLVERQQAQHDRRQVIVRLTAAGEGFHDTAMALRRSAVSEAMSTMSREDRESLARALPAFAAALSFAAREAVGPA